MDSTIKPAYLANTALFLSSFIALNNTYIVMRPSVGLEMLGFQVPSTASNKETKTLTEGLIQMMAASRIVMSVGSVAMWYYKDYRALGWATMAGIIMAGVDGLVADKLGGKGKWVHWGAAPVGLLVGGGLLALVGI